MNDDDPATFVAHRPALLALAYRMLGDMARAEDMVQAPGWTCATAASTGASCGRRGSPTRR